MPNSSWIEYNPVTGNFTIGDVVYDQSQQTVTPVAGSTQYATYGDAQNQITVDLAADLAAHPGSVVTTDAIAYPQGGGRTYVIRNSGISEPGFVPLSPPNVAAGATAEQIATTPDGKYAYVACVDADAIYCYSVSSGALTYLSTVLLPTNVASVATSPDGKYLFVGTAYYPPKIIVVFEINSDGSLTTVVGGGYSPSEYVLGISSHPAGVWLYASTDQGHILQFSQTNGIMTLISSISAPIYWNLNGAILVSKDGKFLYVVNSVSLLAYSIDQTTGALTLWNTYPITAPWGISMSPDGLMLYVTRGRSNNVVQYSVASDGTLTYVTNYILPCLTGGSMEGIDINGMYVYIADRQHNVIYQFSLNLSGYFIDYSETLLMLIGTITNLTYN